MENGKWKMMKIIKQTFILFIASIVLPSILFGQTKSISSETYYSALKEAESKTDKQIRKETQIQKLYTNGKITETITDTTENLSPDKWRWVSVDEENGVVKKTEEICIGNLIYRKEDNSSWVKRGKDDDGFGISGKDNSTREFFIEEATIGKEKFQVLIEKRVNYNKTFFDEVKTWINQEGLILKKSMTTSENDLKNIVSLVEINYNYQIKPPRIEAPIK